MARKQIVELTDDLDPSGSTAADETISFALDGVPYEMDLSSEHCAEFRGMMARYLAVARVLPRTSKTRSSTSRERSAQIRRWAKSAGIEVTDRGRMPASIVRQWEAAGRPAA